MCWSAWPPPSWNRLKSGFPYFVSARFEVASASRWRHRCFSEEREQNSKDADCSKRAPWKRRFPIGLGVRILYWLPPPAVEPTPRRLLSLATPSETHDVFALLQYRFWYASRLLWGFLVLSSIFRAPWCFYSLCKYLVSDSLCFSAFHFVYIYLLRVCAPFSLAHFDDEGRPFES